MTILKILNGIITGALWRKYNNWGIRIILIKCTFPATDRWVEFQAPIWSQNFWRCGEMFSLQKSQIHSEIWTPRYLKEIVIGKGPSEAPWDVPSLSITIKPDLDQFILKMPKFSNSDYSLPQESFVSPSIIIVSSAYGITFSFL